MSENPSKPARQRGFSFDQRHCIACRACQMACKDLHDLPVGVNWRQVTTLEFGRFPNPEVVHLSLSCNHCARPACAEVCPMGAIAKRNEDGLVILDATLCNGCLACLDACPYGALQYDETRSVVGKCDMCRDFLARGEEPACVSACTMRILHAGWLDELEGEETRDYRGLPDPILTGPSLRLFRHRHGKRKPGD